MKKRSVEIMDTTLRDGEQTSGMSYSASEKLTITKLLIEELKVDRIEVASARVSKGEFDAVNRITNWAKEKKFLNKIEILTFLDNGISLEWMLKTGAKVQNLLTKGSLNHLTHQIQKTPKQHFIEISNSVNSAKREGISTNVYLEDWSNGMKNSKDYVFEYLDFLTQQPIERVLLPDTLGILSPSETFYFISEITNRYPKTHFDFHAHNDYDLSVSNVIEALKAGCHGLHLTVNGMGERAGNAPMASVSAVIEDFLPDIEININEESLYKVSKLVSTFTGFKIPVNKPIVGENVFTQTAGIHADGDNKKNLYGSGGIATKLDAARICINAGCHMFIANGKKENPINNMIESKLYTHFIPRISSLDARKKWIISSLSSSGKIYIDQGAARALNNGKSLLAAGIIKIDGVFEKGENVLVVNENNKSLARGLSSFSSSEINKIKGKQSKEIEIILGYLSKSEVIHKDDMVKL